MKKLMILALASVLSFVSCSNDSIDEVTAKQPSKSEKINKSAGREAEDQPRIRFASPYELYYGDVLLKEETGEIVKQVSGVIKGSETDRRQGHIQCSFTDATNNATIYLVQVYGDGQPSTYWIVYEHANGSMSVWQNPGSPCSHFHDLP